MAEPLKYLYNESFFEEYSNAFKKVKPTFKKAKFLKDIYSDGWEDKELKERMHHIALVSHKYFPADFEQATHWIIEMVGHLQTASEEMSFTYMFLPDYIELYGINDFKTSVKAFEVITTFTSCEFAVRPFLIKYPKKMLAQMKRWSKHSNAMVRRLSTEGARPRLPWAMALPDFKKDPAPIIPILERLKNDSSESVRRSVANNLNDISKDNPELVLSLAKSWIGKTPETDWVVKHACRSLLKAGHSDAMQLFGFGDTKQIKVTNLEVKTVKVKIGTSLVFSFYLQNISDHPSLMRVEYGIYYQKANGSLSRKVFKISEREYPGKSRQLVKRNQSFKIITTRKFHIGLHQVSVIINGKEFVKADFELIA